MSGSSPPTTSPSRLRSGSVSRSLEGTREQRVEALTRNFARELAGVGAATGGAAAIPGIGTFTSLSTVAADLSWFTVRSADLILSIAAVHDHTEASVEERRLWILSVLAFGDAASTSVTQLATDVGVAFETTKCQTLRGRLSR